MTSPAGHPLQLRSGLVFFESDLCVKCNICTAACPVAAVTDAFRGPKAVGPQSARFGHPDRPAIDAGIGWCSGCGVCSTVCPHQVPVAEMNIIAKAATRVSPVQALRDWGLSRPEEIGRLTRPLRLLTNAALRSPPLRALAEGLFGLARAAPLPQVAARPFRRLRAAYQRHRPPDPVDDRRPTVAYFHGCSTNEYEPWIGETALEILESLGVDVYLPRQRCCGLPLQSNRDLGAARRRACDNIEHLHPWAERGIPIVGTSTSCTLALKHEYRAVLGLSDAAAQLVAGSTYDFFEYLDHVVAERLADRPRRPLPLRVLYHPPCQLRSHRIGTPALRWLRTVPSLEVVVSQQECCGVAGTYGLKTERYPVAHRTGEPLFARAARERPDVILTDSEACRWWIERHTGIPSRHPLEILAASLGLPSRRPIPGA